MSLVAFPEPAELVRDVLPPNVNVALVYGCLGDVAYGNVESYCNLVILYIFLFAGKLDE